MDISEDVRDKLQRVPSGDRWEWAVKNITEKKWHLTEKDFEKDAMFLDAKYSKSESIVKFLQDLSEAVIISHPRALFLHAWLTEIRKHLNGFA